MINQKIMLVFGYGYTARYLGEALKDLGFDIYATTRQGSIGGGRVYWVLWGQLLSSNILRKVTHILISVPPEHQVGDLVLAKYKHPILQYCKNLQWVGYLSATSVYGDHSGEWVDETASCIPQTIMGKDRLLAEQQWQGMYDNYAVPVHIFRLAGIYGSRRNTLQQIIDGKTYSIYKDGQVFSRIHVHDIVATLLASIAKPNPGRCYNVADDEPAPSHVVDAYAAQLLGLAPLPIISIDDPQIPVQVANFYTCCRRIINNRIKNELGVILKYSSFREGLQQLLLELK